MTLTAKQLFPRSTFVGFDTLLDELDRIARNTNDTFPPHNIVKTSENSFSVELAVAGFAEEDLRVEVKERTLAIYGCSQQTDREYVHKGISTKKFERKFRLSEYVEVTGAEIRNGILAVQLEVIVPESNQPRKIEIKRESKPQLLTES